MRETKITGKIEFCEKELQEFNRTFTATLTESGAFAYGNRTAVVIEWGKMMNGKKAEKVLIDTRYDRLIKQDGSNFKKWVETYFKEHYVEHILTID